MEPIICQIETSSRFKYALTGLHRSSRFPVFSSALEIPKIGIATQDSTSGCDSYLVVPEKMKINIREVPQKFGGVRYAVDQLMNPDSIRFQPCGVREGGIIIHGLVDTIGDNENAKQIFSLFRTCIKKAFKKHNAFYVGSAALRLKSEGYRLTAAVQSPKEYDLA